MPRAQLPPAAGPPPSTADVLRTGPQMYGLMSDPNMAKGVADAPTLLNYADNPGLQNFLGVLGLAAKTLGERADMSGARPDNIQAAVMPGLPNPQGLPLTKVMSGDQPTRVYHGTKRSFDQFDLSKADPDALFGPGMYFTEDPKTAAGYAGQPLQVSYDAWVQQMGEHTIPRPNIRPAHLDITNPLDLGAKADPALVTELEKQITRAAQSSTLPSWLREGVNVHALAAAAAARAGKATNEDVYVGLTKFLDKPLLTEALKNRGYDGITHIGGARTGNTPHRVWIGFKPEQEINPYEYAATLRGQRLPPLPR